MKFPKLGNTVKVDEVAEQDLQAHSSKKDKTRFPDGEYGKDYTITFGIDPVWFIFPGCFALYLGLLIGADYIGLGDSPIVEFIMFYFLVFALLSLPLIVVISSVLLFLPTRRENPDDLAGNIRRENAIEWKLWKYAAGITFVIYSIWNIV